MSPSPDTPDFSGALPDRAIIVRPPQTIGPLSAAGVFALLLGLLCGALLWLGPDLARDWRINGDVVRAEGARIEQARCRSRLVLINVCDVAFIDERSADRSRQRLWYFFIDTIRQEPIVLVRPRSDADAITTNLGLDKFYHRVLALTLIVALLAFCIVLSAQFVRQGRLTRRALAMLNGQRLTPIVVALEGSISIAHKRRRWTYVHNVDGRKERAFVEFASGNDPLFVTPDGKQALALRGEREGVPLLLDAKLSCLDLTEDEKATFFAACRKALAVEAAA
jgi:hypothetical protein